ncbi:hypothetical protein ACWD5Q_12780 [Streptomyces sp. NPDC002513]
MLEALIRGEADPQVLTDPAKRKLRNRIPEPTEALTGRFREHHAFLARLYLDQYDQLTTVIGQLTGRIEAAMAPFRGALDLLDTIPGINQATAEPEGDRRLTSRPGHPAAFIDHRATAHAPSDQALFTRQRHEAVVAVRDLCRRPQRTGRMRAHTES